MLADLLKIASVSDVYPDWLREPEITDALNVAVADGYTKGKSAKQMAADVQAVHDRLVKEGKNWLPQD
jgi:dTDP-glucose pyrophosphorylase